MKLTLSVFVFLAFGLVVAGQSRKPRKSIVKPAPAQTPVKTAEAVSDEKPNVIVDKNNILQMKRFSEEAFTSENLQWEKLPANYEGNDFEKIFEKLSGSFKPKDEFETTAAYEKRLNEAASQPLVGNLTAQSKMAFVYKFHEAAPETSVSYDADAGKLSVSISLRNNDSLIGRYSLKSLGAKESKLLEEKSYEARNGFGASTRVFSTKIEKYEVVFSNIKEFKPYLSDIGPDGLSDETKYSFSDFRFMLDLVPEKAREAKNDLAYLVIFSPSKPFAGIGHSRFAPKYDRPIEREEIVKYIQGSLDEIWFFNRATGEIYQKIKAAPISSGKLKITSFPRTDGYMILDKSMVEILKESGAAAVENTKLGNDYDLLQTFIKGMAKPNDKKYQSFVEKAIATLRPHIIEYVSSKAYGEAIAENLKFGRYFVFGMATDYSKAFVWDKPIEFNQELQSLYLTINNAEYK